jgi:hypothetical protein
MTASLTNRAAIMWVPTCLSVGGPMSKSSQQVPQPPKPPEFGRELELRCLNVIRVGLLALLVLLALLGVFGYSQGEASNAGEVLALEVT